jgi:hypothetical protein
VDGLSKLNEFLIENDSSVPVGLMIGGDCTEAIQPREVIQSEGRGPYAERSLLGWSVIGPIAKTKPTSTNCNLTRFRIPVKDVSSNQISTHCFALTNTMRDSYITKTLTDMYKQEFTEVASEKRSLSVEDR